MNGIILINKEKQYTSHDVVAKLKRIINEKKVGHTGTLDPNATGVLPILLGEATKISKYLINHDKEYEVVLKLGEKTSTGDSEGKVLLNGDVSFDSILGAKGTPLSQRIDNILQSFVGKQKQTPPMYSAIKVKGKKLYEYARKGQTVDIPKRDIEIYNIKLTNIDTENYLIYFTVNCSKGTYIRTLCEDIAEKLGTVGYMKELNRTKAGTFDIRNAVKIDAQDIANYVITIENLFIDKDKVILNNDEISKFLNGMLLDFDLKDEIYKIYNKDNIFIGLGVVKYKKLKRDVVLV